MTRSKLLHQGFTLIELIIVIVLLGIMGTFVFSYIGFGAEIYRDSSARERLMSQSRFAMERITIELVNALPRSTRVSVDQLCLEYMPIVTSGQYLELPLAPSDSTAFRAIAPLVDNPNDLLNHYLVVFAANPSFIYGSSDERRKKITAVAAGSGDYDVVLSFADAVVDYFTGTSPAQRYYITSDPISWCYQPSSQQLWRYSGYGLLATAPSLGVLQANPFAVGHVMAEGLNNQLGATQPELPFVIDDATLVRNSLIQIDWRFVEPNSGESIHLLQELHVPNVP